MIYDKPEHYMYNGAIIPMEFWKPVTDEMVPGVEPIYWISNIGNLYNSKTGKFSNALIKENDYVRVMLSHKDGSKHMTTIHRLVCMAFHGLPPEPNYEVDHVNCIKSCSVENNLEWVTKQENNRRACENNLLHVAEDNYHSILTNEEAEEICIMLSNGIPIRTICDIMDKKIYPRKYAGGIESIVYQILHRAIWTSISKNYQFYDYSRIHLSDNEIHLVCKALEDGCQYDYIIDNILKLECDSHKRERLKETFYHIKRGKAFTNISSQYNISNKRKLTLSDEELNMVCKMVAEEKSNKEILSALGSRANEEKVRTAVYDIKRGSCHKKLVESYKK